MGHVALGDGGAGRFGVDGDVDVGVGGLVVSAAAGDPAVPLQEPQPGRRPRHLPPPVAASTDAHLPGTKSSFSATVSRSSRRSPRLSQVLERRVPVLGELMLEDNDVERLPADFLAGLAVRRLLLWNNDLQHVDDDWMGRAASQVPPLSLSLSLSSSLRPIQSMSWFCSPRPPARGAAHPRGSLGDAVGGQSPVAGLAAPLDRGTDAADVAAAAGGVPLAGAAPRRRQPPGTAAERPLRPTAAADERPDHARAAERRRERVVRPPGTPAQPQPERQSADPFAGRRLPIAAPSPGSIRFNSSGCSSGS